MLFIESLLFFYYFVVVLKWFYVYSDLILCFLFFVVGIFFIVYGREVGVIEFLIFFFNWDLKIKDS